MRVGERWKHFKGSEYVIIGFINGAEDHDIVQRVRYLSNLGIEFSRPMDNFLETIVRGTYNGPRFVKV